MVGNKQKFILSEVAQNKKDRHVCICLYVDFSYKVNESQVTVHRTTKVRYSIRDWRQDIISICQNRVDSYGWQEGETKNRIQRGTTKAKCHLRDVIKTYYNSSFLKYIHIYI